MRSPARWVSIAVLAVLLAATGRAAVNPVRGWTILSDSEPDALAVITAAPAYAINHLQLSHHLVDDLADLRDAVKQQRVRRLIRAAHEAAIGEVVLWDHALYDLKPPAGQWNWVEDADAGMRYYDLITREGWPAETRGVANPYAGMTFPLEAK